MPVQVYKHGSGGVRKATPPWCRRSRDGVLRWMEAYAHALASGVYKVCTSGGLEREGCCVQCRVSPACCLFTGPCREREFPSDRATLAHQGGHCGCAQLC